MVRIAGIALALQLVYLAATALWSPLESQSWYGGRDAQIFIHAAQSVGTGRYDTYDGDPRFRYSRPPGYPIIVWALGADNSDGPSWPLLICNATLASLACMSIAAILTMMGYEPVTVRIAGIVAASMLLPYPALVRPDLANVAFCYGASALVLLAAKRRSYAFAVVAGLVLGYAGIVRSTATVFVIGAPLAALGLYGTRSWRTIVVVIAVSLPIPLGWAAHVNSQVGVFSVATHGLANNLYCRTIPGLKARGVPAVHAALSDEAYAREFREVPLDWNDRERIEWERAELRANASLFWPNIVPLVVRTTGHVLLSSTSPWKLQFPIDVPRLILRPLYLGIGLLFLLGAAVSVRRRGWTLAGALMFLWCGFLVLVILLGASMAHRHMLPALLSTAAFHAEGIAFLYDRIRRRLVS